MKLILFLTIAVIAVLGFLITKSESPSFIPSSVTQEQPKKIGIPQKLSIPTLNVYAEIIPLGKDSQGRMDIPSNPSQVGWYALGYRPGQDGSAVIAGHLDQRDGSRAVFYDLSVLLEGDQIIVTDDMGTERTFKVTKKAIYKHDELPLEQIFNTYGEVRLNLITCEGDFVNGNYSDRLVIYSVEI